MSYDIYKDDVLRTLFNKYRGYASTSAVGQTSATDLAVEFQNNATANVPLEKLYTDPIPSTITKLIGTASGALTASETINGKTVNYKYDGSYNQIKKYTDIALTTYNNSDIAFIFDILPQYNILKETIPSNVDPLGTYKVTVTSTKLAGVVLTPDRYILDSDAGILIVKDIAGSPATNLADKTHPPTITFCRYVGSKGKLATNWSTAAANTSIDLSTNYVYNMGDLSNTVMYNKFSNYGDISGGFAVSKSYVENLISHINVTANPSDISGWSKYAAVRDVSMAGYHLKQLGDPSDVSDAVNLGYLQTRYMDICGLNLHTSLNLSGQKIINLSSNVSVSGDAVEYSWLKGYLGSNYLNLSGDAVGDVMRGNLEMSNNFIFMPSTVADTSDNYVVNAKFVKAAINNLRSNFGASGSLDMCNNYIIGLKDISFTDLSQGSYAINRNYLEKYVPNGSNYGDYLSWDTTKSNGWSVRGSNIAIGIGSEPTGHANTASNAIAIGYGAGTDTQGSNAIAIGVGAGKHQGSNAIAIGFNAGIDIDNPLTIQTANSIAINASSDPSGLKVTTSGLYIKPITKTASTYDGNSGYVLIYNPTSGFVEYADISNGVIGSSNASELASNVSNWAHFPANSNVNMNDGTQRYIYNLADPTHDDYAVNLGYLNANFLDLNGSNAMNSNLNMGTNSIYNLVSNSGTSAAAGYAVEFSYLSNTYATKTSVNDVSNSLSTYLLKTGDTASNLKVNTPGDTDISNAANVNYVQSYVSTYVNNHTPATVDLSKWAENAAIQDVDISQQYVTNLHDLSRNDMTQNSYAVNKKYVDTIDDWLSYYIRDQPPAPVLDYSGANSANIYLGVINPEQHMYGILSKKLPVINNINIDISNGYKIPLAANTQYIPDLSEVNMFVITKQRITDANRYGTYTANGKTYHAYYYNDTALNTRLAAGSQAIALDYWYTNSSENSIHKLHTMIGPYAASGNPPSIPRNLLFSSVNSTGMTTSWTSPLESESSTTNSLPLSYNITYHPADTVRYGGVYSTTDSNVNGLTSTTNTMSGLNPGTNYIVGVKAYNNVSSTPSTELSGIQMTSYPTAPGNITTKTLSLGTNYNITGTDLSNICLCNDTNGTTKINASVTPVIKKSAIISFTTINDLAINDGTNPGATGNDIMILTPSLKLAGSTITSLSANVYKFNGFGNPTLSNSSGGTADIQLSATVIDNGTGNTSGFFYKTSLDIVLKPTNVTTPALNATTDKYSLTISQELGAPPSTVTNSKDFYVDDISGLPVVTVNDPTDISNTKVCGITILNNSYTPSINAIVSNLYNKFYIANETFKVIMKAGATSMNTYTYNNKNTYNGTTATFNNLTYDINSQTYYATTWGFDVTAKNLNGTATGNKTVSRIIDPRTLVLNSSIPSSLQNLSTGYQQGSRVLTPDLTDLTGASAIRGQFNNTVALPPNELLLAKGKFRTSKNDVTVYMNYASYDSGPNYSGLTGTRYVTFGWTLPSTFVGTSVTFKFDDVEPGISMNSDVAKQIYFVNPNDINDKTNVLNIYYRFVQQSDTSLLNSTVTDGINKTTSVWVKLNGNAYADSFGAKYAVASNNETIDGKATGAVTASSNNFEITGVCPSQNYSVAGPTNIYLAIECPYDKNIAFGNVSCKF